MTNDTNQSTADNPDLTETFKELLKNSDVSGIEDVIKKENMKDTWTGRGKQPNWLQAHIANGRSIEEFEVKDAEESESETESQAKA